MNHLYIVYMLEIMADVPNRNNCKNTNSVVILTHILGTLIKLHFVLQIIHSL